MGDDLRQQIYKNFSLKGTDELIEIWKTNNRADWTALTFDVIRQILHERLVDLPPQGEPANEEIRAVDGADRMTLAQLYFSFNGRIGLGTYWLKGVLPILVLSILVGYIEGVTPAYSSYSGIPTILWRVFLIWPALALTVKRWHDRDKSGWWIFIALIPLLGFVWAFVETGFFPGKEGPNLYGSKSF